jgi:exodeoxyribonuclease VII large subunit
MLLSPWLNWHDKLKRSRLRLFQSMSLKLSLAGLRLETLKRRLRHPGQKLAWQQQCLAYSLNRLRTAGRGRLAHKRTRLEFLQNRLSRVSLSQAVYIRGQRLAGLRARAGQAQRNRLDQREKHLYSTRARLNTLNPLAILARGYALARDKKGIIIREPGQVTSGQTLDILLARGEIKVRVESL